MNKQQNSPPDSPAGSGSSYLQSTQPMPGMRLSILNGAFPEALTVQMEDDSPALDFSFWLAGGIHSKVAGLKSPFEMTAGECNINFVPQASAQVTTPAKTRLRNLSIRVEPDAFFKLIGEDAGILPDVLRQILEGHVDQAWLSKGLIAAPVRSVLDQLLNNPYQGSLHHLYQQSKTQEIMIMMLAELRRGEKTCKTTIALRPSDIARIHEARAILSQDLAHPPSLLELAHAVGLNDYKLKAGFRQVFGTTVFASLRDMRLQQAMEILREGELNVGQIACTIGFSNPSHFTALFKKKFGVSPHTFRVANRSI